MSIAKSFFESGVYSFSRLMGWYGAQNDVRLNLAHIQAFAQCSNWPRFENLIRYYWEMYNGVDMIKTAPFIMDIEPTDKCNLSCPFCPTGNKLDTGRSTSKLDLDNFKRVVDQTYEKMYFACFSEWGEPLLNPETYDMIEYLNRKNVYTMVSSNMSFVNSPENVDRLINSGLDYLTIAIDGITQKTYDKYRIGGNLRNVLTNSMQVINRRNELGLKKPFVEWQFVIFKHNQDEAKHVRRLATMMGVDRLYLKKAYIEDVDWQPDKDEDFKTELFSNASLQSCARPWRNLVIRADGGLSPCCYTYYKKDDFHHISDFGGDISKMWNSDTYKRSRRTIYDIATGKEVPEDKKFVCDGCIRYNQKPLISVNENADQGRLEKVVAFREKARKGGRKHKPTFEV